MLGPFCHSVACFLLVYSYLPDCIFSFYHGFIFFFYLCLHWCIFYTQYLKMIAVVLSHIISSYPIVKILITVLRWCTILYAVFENYCCYFVHIISSYPLVKILITVCHYIAIFNYYVQNLKLFVDMTVMHVHGSAVFLVFCVLLDDNTFPLEGMSIVSHTNWVLSEINCCTHL